MKVYNWLINRKVTSDDVRNNFMPKMLAYEYYYKRIKVKIEY